MYSLAKLEVWHSGPAVGDRCVRGVRDRRGRPPAPGWWWECGS